jgi:hypothetical protein
VRRARETVAPGGVLKIRCPSGSTSVRQMVGIDRTAICTDVGDVAALLDLLLGRVMVRGT